MADRTVALGLVIAVCLVLGSGSSAWADAGGAHSAPVQVAAHGAQFPRAQVLVFGRVSRRVTNHQTKLERLADWLAARLRKVGIRAGSALVLPSVGQMVAALREGRVDVAWESVLAALHYEAETGAELLMQDTRDGLGLYQSVFLTRRTAPIFTLQDLAGRRIAFEDAGSTSAFLLPLAAMMSAGLKPVRLSDAAAPVPDGTVGYVFAGNEGNIAAWTAGGRVDAGAFGSDDWLDDSKNPKTYAQQMRIFAVTPPLPRPVLVVSRGMRPEVRAALVAALADYHAAPEIADLRKEYFTRSRFIPVTAGKLRGLDDAREIYRLVRPMLGG